tara:strand:+ start:181 stop:651 length:471 start_codon:yes stop_codon:yes gene_type:complete
MSGIIGSAGSKSGVIGTTTTTDLPYFTAHITGSGYTSVASGSPVPLNSCPINNGGHFDTSTYKFTAPVEGLYLFTWSSIHNNSSATSRPMFYVDGTTHHNGIQHGISGQDSTGSHQNATSALIPLAAGQYVTVSSNNGNIYYYGGAHASFTGCLIR